MLRTLRCRIQHPEFRTASSWHQRVLFLNTPNRLTKFERNFQECVRRKKQSKIQPIFNQHLPYITEENPSSDDFYPRGENPARLNFKNYYFPDEFRVAVKPFPRFFVSTFNEDKINIEEKLIISDTINGLNLDLLDYEMRQKYYAKLGPGPEEKKKKCWYPVSTACLNAVTTAEKLYGYALFDPLNPGGTFKQTNLSEIFNARESERNKFISNRYKHLNRAKDMFLLFDISTYNINLLHDFIISQILDRDNLFCLGHNLYGYTATFLFPVSAMAANPNSFFENEIVKFYDRGYDEMVNDVDPNYKILKPKILEENYKNISPPQDSKVNQDFLKSLSFSVKKTIQPVEEHYLMVVVQSDYELHENDTPNCNNEGWFYRPEVYGRIVTIIPYERKNLPVLARPWVSRRAQRKGIGIGILP